MTGEPHSGNSGSGEPGPGEAAGGRDPWREGAA